MNTPRRKIQNVFRPTGPKLDAEGYRTGAPSWMPMNNLRAEVAERPDELMAFGGINRAACTGDRFGLIFATPKARVAQPAKPIALRRTHPCAPRGVSSTSNRPPRKHFNEVERKDLRMFAMTTATRPAQIVAQGTHLARGDIVADRTSVHCPRDGCPPNARTISEWRAARHERVVAMAGIRECSVRPIIPGAAKWPHQTPGVMPMRANRSRSIAHPLRMPEQ